MTATITLAIVPDGVEVPVTEDGRAATYEEDSWVIVRRTEVVPPWFTLATGERTSWGVGALMLPLADGRWYWDECREDAEDWHDRVASVRAAFPGAREVLLFTRF